MKCCENESTPQGTFIYRGLLTSRYRNIQSRDSNEFDQN